MAFIIILVAMLVSLEAVPPSKNVPLMGAYEAAWPRIMDEAGEEERKLLHDLLAKPLDVAGYRAYAAWLAGADKAAAKRFAEAALAYFAGDAELEKARAG